MSENLDPFLAKMATEKVRLDAKDRLLEAAGVSAASWGSSISEGGGYASTVQASRGNKAVRSV